VSQSNLSHNGELTANTLSPSTDWVGADLSLSLAPADYQVLLDELADAQKLDRQRRSRIHHLEQALDQALACIDDLKRQLKDQTVLEHQLASTEEFSYVQRQAIARLKLQLSEQQQCLDTQILETQQRDQAVQELLETIEEMTQTQQQELERLRLRLMEDQQAVQRDRQRLNQQIQDLQSLLDNRQQRVVQLESETLAARTRSATLQGQLEAAQQRIKDLSGSLRQYRSNLTRLQTELEHAQVTLTNHQNLVTSLHQNQAMVSQQDQQIETLEADLALARQQLEELETQLGQQMIQEGLWQRSQQELQEERDRLQTRVLTLEQQTAEMQEQILYQRQHATEQETAIQYWKDRYMASQGQMFELGDQLAQLLDDPKLKDDRLKVRLAQMLSQLQTDAPTKGTKPFSAVPLPQLHTLELPAFLNRRSSSKDKGMRV
jgi:chromosome segregation ATPase